MRSGRMKSSTAAPSFRNSGLLTTEKPMPGSPQAAQRQFLADHRADPSAVPTGTVDLSTTTLKPRMWRPMSRAAAST